MQLNFLPCLQILAPMSDIAGRLSVQIGACLLQSSQKAKGCCWAVCLRTDGGRW